MHHIRELYGQRLALLTDLYQLTMAYGYWKHGLAERRAVFHLFFRRNPFQGGYTLAAGLGTVIELLQDWRFEAADLAYLATLTGADDRPLFEAAFLDYLATVRFACDVDAIPEGTVVFPHEPLVRVTGPILQCQILETPLLNMINFQSLLATKAARVCWAAAGDRVIEFGLRRAQGIDGGIAAARAAFIGGCAGTSNVLAGRLFGLPVVGTHAHSWVMTFDTEAEAFDAYADAMPNNCVFLVDTYDTLEGVRRAVATGQRLRAAGHKMLGIRLDSGDLAWLSIEARKILDAGGFPDAAIVASNDLDERLILSLKQQGARINVWGVGTKLVTAYEQPALGGVYKLGAICDEDGRWRPRIKLSEQAIKVTNPGILQVRRFDGGGEYLGDMLWDEADSADRQHQGCELIDPMDAHRRKRIAASANYRDLLEPIFRQGALVYAPPALAAIQEHARQNLQRTPLSTKRFEHPHTYPVGLSARLHERKTRMIQAARSELGSANVGGGTEP